MLHTLRQTRRARRSAPLIRSGRIALLVGAFLACGLAGYAIEPEKYIYAHSWSMADPLCGILATITLWLFLLGKWRMDTPSLWMAAYVCMYAVTMTFNATWNSGTALNFFRTATAALVLYIVVHNVMCNIDDLKWFYWLTALLGIIVSLTGIFVLIGQWADNFAKVLNVVSVLGSGPNTMNSWAFVQVMCLAIALAWWFQSPAAVHRALTCAVLGVGIALSLSRTAYSCLVLILLFAVVGARRRHAKRVIVIVFSVVGAIWLAIGQLSEAVPQAMTLAGEKLNTYQSDLNDTRLVALTIDPLMAWLRQSPVVWIVGDGSSQQHNLLTNCLWMTGLLGTFLMVGYHTALFRKALKLWRAERKTYSAPATLGSVFFALILVMLLDDLLTNLRNHSSGVAYTFAVLAGGLSSAAAWSNCGHSTTTGHAAHPNYRYRIRAGGRLSPSQALPARNPAPSLLDGRVTMNPDLSRD